MRKPLWYLSLFFLALVNPLFADPTVTLDDQNIQEFRGKLGKWVLIQSKNQLQTVVSEISAGMDEVSRVNGAENIRSAGGQYLFIPYSEKHIQQLESQGICRKTTECRENQFIWPVDGVNQLTSVFGLRWGEMHEGLDMPVPKGTIIRAARSGKVIASGYSGGYGKEILIEHRDNYITRYAHNSVNFVKEGDFVKQGQVIGLVGSSGNSTGSHLHFEIRSNDIPLDPLDLLPKNEHLDLMNARLKNWK